MTVGMILGTVLVVRFMTLGTVLVVRFRVYTITAIKILLALL